MRLEGETKLKKIPKQEYTAEFKELSVKRVKAGQSVGAVARELGLIEQTLRNWVKAAEAAAASMSASGRTTTGHDAPSSSESFLTPAIAAMCSPVAVRSRIARWPLPCASPATASI